MHSETEVIVGAANIAKAMGVTRRQVYGYIENGVLPCVRLGGSVAVRRKTLVSWLEGLEATAKAA